MRRPLDVSLEEAIKVMKRRLINSSRCDSYGDGKKLIADAAELFSDVEVTMRNERSDQEKKVALARSERDQWERLYRQAEADAMRFKAQLRALGTSPLPSESGSSSRDSPSRGRRSGSRPRSGNGNGSRDRSTSRRGGLRRRDSDASRHVHFASSAINRNSPPESMRQDNERRRGTYSLSGEELRNRNSADRAESERKKKKILAERDRLAQRFEIHSRGPPRVYFPGVSQPHGPPHPPPPPPPPPPPAPPPPPPHPFMYDDFYIPPPIPDPLAVHPDEIPHRPGAIPWDFREYVLRQRTDGPHW
ncbi:hypothetical protein BBAD15_g5513 [Beauveria bassiana D1-5]|nr:hypothetical protein BBAD15_g5513 [Beauveria bassiana D1-5]